MIDIKKIKSMCFILLNLSLWIIHERAGMQFAWMWYQNPKFISKTLISSLILIINPNFSFVLHHISPGNPGKHAISFFLECFFNFFTFYCCYFLLFFFTSLLFSFIASFFSLLLAHVAFIYIHQLHHFLSFSSN